MDSISLVETAKIDGERLLYSLDRAGFKVSTAFWIRGEEDLQWRLMIVNPEIPPGGFRTAYGEVRNHLTSLSPPTAIELNDVWLIRPTEPIVKLIATLRRGGKSEDFMVKNGVVNGIHIDEAFVYRLLAA